MLLPSVVSASRDRVDARMVVGPGKLGGQKVQGAAVGMKAAFRGGPHPLDSSAAKLRWMSRFMFLSRFRLR